MKNLLTSRLRRIQLDVEWITESEERHRRTLRLLEPIQTLQRSTELSILDCDPSSGRIDSVCEWVDDLVAQHDSNASRFRRPRRDDGRLRVL